MGTIRTRRALAAAAALTVTGAVLFAGAGTAFAAADSLHINIRDSDVTLPKAVNGSAVTKTLHINVAHDLAGHVPSATLTVDARTLAGVADIVWPSVCTHTGSVGTCKIDHVYDNEGPVAPPTFLALGLKAGAHAANGAHGTLKFHASAPGLDSDETSTSITVGSGADLTVRQLAPVNHAKVGSTLTSRIQWSNTGNQTATSTVVTLQTMAGLAFTQHFSNCTYSKPFGPLGIVTAVCKINTPLAPGKSLRLASDIRLGVTSEAWYTLMTASVSAGSQAKAAVAQSSGNAAGTGPELTAQAVTTPTAVAQSADLNPNDNYTELDVRADNHAHFSAVGGAAHGTKGQTVQVTVGMRNSGPALVYDRSGGEGTDALKVTFPAGTTVTKVPPGCDLLRKGGVAGHGPYECGEAGSYVQGPKYRALFTFGVRLDQVLDNARGTAALTNMNSDFTGAPVTFPWDTSTTGYTAPIVFNGPVPPTTTPTSSASTSTTGTSGNAPAADGTANGTLASTGAGSGTQAIAIAGAAAAVLGGGALVLSRRRRAAR